MNKSDLRQQLITQRQQIAKALHQTMSEEICTQIADTNLFKESITICAYASFRQEPDLSALFTTHPQKRWLFPRCVINCQDRGSQCLTDNHLTDFSLTWHEVNPRKWSDFMVKGHYGIWEPHPDLPAVNLTLDLTSDSIPIDLILVPAVAGDRQGYRLGYGAGFYDRWLPQQTAPTVGIIFSEFMREKLPHDSWDIPLDYLLTERGLWDCRREL